jgi:hypothetical protein
MVSGERIDKKETVRRKNLFLGMGKEKERKRHHGFETGKNSAEAKFIPV